MKGLAWKPEEHRWLLSIGLSFSRIFCLLVPLVLKWSGHSKWSSLGEGPVGWEEGGRAWLGAVDGRMVKCWVWKMRPVAVCRSRAMV